MEAEAGGGSGVYKPASPQNLGPASSGRSRRPQQEPALPTPGRASRAQGAGTAGVLVAPGQKHGTRTRFVGLDTGRVYLLAAFLHFSTLY